ncbi:MAG TPA: ScyD/ScyE family protein [Marmoricola sp.]|nr:ScyD/ScyE family protein [Marmoricola sp.]
MGSTDRLRRNSLVAIAAAALAASGLAASPVATAQPGQVGRSDPARSRLVAHGLDNPRLLGFDAHGRLYVAEAGKGGKLRCGPGPEGGTVCLGMSGAITRVWRGHQRRIVDRLPSIAGKDGTSALGPADVRVGRGHVWISVGAGIDAKQRRAFGKRAMLLGTLLRTTVAHPRSRHVLADIVRFERRNNPDHSKAHDSDPTGFVPDGHSFVLADSGGNDILRIRRGGAVRVMAVLKDRMVPAPDFLGLPPGTKIPMQAVPTAVARGARAFYISQLTGFPFPVGAANIYKLRPGHRPRVWASGLTNVTDLAWHRGRLYAVEIASDGLLAAETGGGLPMGALIRVHKGDNSSPHVVAGNLPAPYGVALRGAAAYVTTCAVCPGGGSVMRIPVG